jgi:hypothetical protein
MDLTRLDVEPELRQAQDGSWLAITPPETPINLGAMGATESLAKQGFFAAVRLLREALDSDPR